MATSPSKRRKLGHRESGPVSIDNHDDSESDASSREAPALPQKNGHHKSRHTQQDADGAVFAGTLYKSSMFKLQVDEMLAEVQPNHEKQFKGVDDALRRLKTQIESIGPRDPLSISEARQFLHKSFKVVAPYPTPKPDDSAAYKLEYAKPSNINVVGSYVLKTMTKSDTTPSVDMVVVMPASIFQEKDYLNYRYFYKRAFYLACIAGGLQRHFEDEFSFSFQQLNGNDLQPILVIKPRPKKGEIDLTNFEIHIIPSAPQGFFAEAKLRPYKNAIRSKEASETGSQPATPFYNASIRSDSNTLLYLKLMHSASKQSEGYKSACILGRIWLRQRGFGTSVQAGGFGHFEWSALTALLLEGGGPKGQSLLSGGYSSYQTFKAVLQFLSSSDLIRNPLIHRTSDYVSSKQEFPMIFDGLRGQNLLFKMTPWSYALLREEATTSLIMLNDSAFDQFEATFITRSAQLLQRFDCIIKVPMSASVSSDRGDHQQPGGVLSSKLYSLFQEGLGDRIRSMDIIRPVPTPWFTKLTVSDLADETLLVCVTFDAMNIDRLVDHGPSAEEKKAAAKFQKFWGQKAELRRFRDGSILESLVWSPGSSYAVFKQIVVHVVKRHLGNDLSSKLVFVGDDFDKLLSDQSSARKSFEELRSAFRTLETTFRELEGLPLQLRQLAPISPQLRYTSITPPNLSPLTVLSSPADVLIQFEGSGRWPDDITAIQRIKIAFLLKIGSLLAEADSTITTRLGLEHETKEMQNCAYLDVIYDAGPTFRLRIQTEREQALIDRIIKDKSTLNRSREEALLALTEFKKTAVQLPLHTQSITTHCTRFPLLGPTIRLFKTWLERHMLLSHMSEEFIELLCARTFLQPYPWTPPSSVSTGLLRTLLFLSKWDWRQSPLIVDFSGTMTSADVSAITTRLEAWRKIDPAMNRTVIVAATNHDPTGTTLTTHQPSKMVAARLTALSRSACKLVKEHGVALDPRSLFVSSLTDYDFVIHLSSKYVMKAGDAGSKQKFKNLEVQSASSHENVGYHPIERYLEELRNLYADCIVFFYGSTNQHTIAGLWNPQVITKRQFKVNLDYATRAAEGENDEIVVDKQSILSEISRLGGDMISKLEINRG